MLAWESIPGHLSQENKKFVYGKVRKGSRAADFEESLAWLEQAGLIRKVRRASKPGIPLPAYCESGAFKGAHPEVKAVRFSLSGYREQDWMRNVPLYAVSCKGLWS